MAIKYLLGWWYGRGWGWVLNSIFSNLRSVQETFSVPILLRTWFSPWKQIQTPSSFRNFFQAAIDNLVSRFIGALLRTFMLIAAFFLIIGVLAFGFLAFVAWPFIPLSIIILLVTSLVV